MFAFCQVVAVGALGGNHGNVRLVIGGFFGKLGVRNVPGVGEVLLEAYNDLECRYSLSSQSLVDILHHFPAVDEKSPGSSIECSELTALHSVYQQCCKLRLQMNRVRILLQCHTQPEVEETFEGESSGQEAGIVTFSGAPVNLLVGLAGHLMDGLLNVCASAQQSVSSLQALLKHWK